MIKVSQVYFSKGVTETSQGINDPLADRFTRLLSNYYPYYLTFVVHVSLIIDEVSKTKPTLQIRVTQDGTILYQTGKLPLAIEGMPKPRRSYQFAHRLEEIKFAQPGSYIVEILINGQIRYLKALTLH